MEHKVNIILTRHGKYDKSNDKKLAGHLTEEGKKEIEEKTKKRIQIFNDNLLNTMFLVVGSPTYWLSKKHFGQRAIETAIITKQTIKKELIRQGVDIKDVNNFFYTNPKVYKRDIKNSVSIEDSSKLLAEPNVYDVAPEYIKKLKLKYNGMNSHFWEELCSSEEAKMYNDKAETPSVLNKKIKLMLNYVLEWSKTYSEEKHKDICAILITHGETMMPFLNSEKLRSICRNRL